MSDFTPPPPPAYGAAPVPGAVPPNHPKAVLSLVLGIIGLLCCGPVGIAAFIIGRKTEKEIIASNGSLGGAGLAKAGWILGAIAIVLLILGIVFYAILFAVGGFESTVETSTY